MIKILRAVLERFTEALCYAASLDKVELRSRHREQSQAG